ncbi:MAG: CheR family methyltransferase [Candidatus Binatia bacterium]
MSETTQQRREFQALLEFIKRSRGFDFSGYKSPSLMRRVNKRMETAGMKTFGNYLDYLEVHPEEFYLLFNTILINVTTFFRDAEAWDYVTKEIVPQIIAHKPSDQPIRIWSAGCASGEEAYTLTIVLAEALGMEQFEQRVKIYATDVDEDALSAARQASYDLKNLEHIPAGLRKKYFESVGNRYVFRPVPRRAVIFGRHDLIHDAPISRLDLLVCRNTLMYFNAEIQSRILARFHFALNDKGLLFLGKAEMLLTHASLFTPLNLKYHIFSKLPQLSVRHHLPLLVQTGNAEAANTLVRYGRLRDAALDAVPVAQIVLDSQGNLVLANEHARTLFILHPKDLGRPFQDLELSYRPAELRSLLDEVTTTRRPATLHEVEWSPPGQETRYLNVEVAPLPDNGTDLAGASICFIDVTRSHQLRQELQRSSQELETAYEELQSTNEELETTNEELQSTVEELETTNEELQSTNEEMETMNEELQSTNQELQTINEQLRQRTDELHTANSFLESILTGLRTAVVVVDRSLAILSWNHRAEDLWGLRADEVKGQSFLNLDTGLPVQSLKNCIRAVLAEKSGHEEVVLHATNRRGKAIRCRVICTPLRDAGKGVQGGILLMEEGEEQQ